jgi:hypothetical protein
MKTEPKETKTWQLWLITAGSLLFVLCLIVFDKRHPHPGRYTFLWIGLAVVIVGAPVSEYVRRLVLWLRYSLPIKEFPWSTKKLYLRRGWATIQLRCKGIRLVTSFVHEERARLALNEYDEKYRRCGDRYLPKGERLANELEVAERLVAKMKSDFNEAYDFLLQLGYFTKEELEYDKFVQELGRELARRGEAEMGEVLKRGGV